MTRRGPLFPPPPSDPYAVLGVDRRATDADIKRAYFARVREHPPERDARAFQEIRSAYERVGTPEARARTDLFLLQPPPGPPRRRLPSPDLEVHGEDVLAIAAARLLDRLARSESFREPEPGEDEA